MKSRVVSAVTFITTLTTAFMLLTGRAFAASAAFCSGNGGGFLGFPTWYKYLNPQFVGGECVLNATFPGDLGKIALAIIEILLRVGGLVAVAFVIYGGFNYITSQGEPDKTKSARQTIQNAIIGLVIATLATVIISFIGSTFV